MDCCILCLVDSIQLDVLIVNICIVVPRPFAVVMFLFPVQGWAKYYYFNSMITWRTLCMSNISLLPSLNLQKDPHLPPYHCLGLVILVLQLPSQFQQL